LLILSLFLDIFGLEPRSAWQRRKIIRLPFEGIKKLKHNAEKKQLPSTEDMEKYVTSAINECPQSGKQFADYLRLLMYPT